MATLTPPELAALGTAAFGHQWQSALARTLSVSDRTVRRWAAGSSPIPDTLEDELAAALGWTKRGRPDWPRDQWIIGDGVETASNTRREYIIHTRKPRFMARVIALDELTGEPQPDEGDTDFSGVVFQAGPDSQFCEIVWIDPPPAGRKLSALMESAADALEY